MDNRKKGNMGEKIAEAFLIDKGARILERNYTARGGEIDLIVEMDDTLVFVEVKYRENRAMEEGAESITLHKRRNICRAALQYLHRRGQLDARVRFDAIIIMLPDVTHIPAAFEYIE